MNPIRVLVVDDDPLVRRGLRLLLGREPELEIVAEAEDGDAAVQTVERESVDVVLMDLKMPRRNGVAATQAITSRAHAPEILVLTTLATDDAIADALAAGASGFLLKDAEPDDLVDGIRAVARGRRSLSPAVLDTLVDRAVRARHRTTHARARLDTLTEQERAVATCVRDNLTNPEIAERLHMSVGNVKACIRRVFTKVGVNGRLQLADVFRDAEL